MTATFVLLLLSACFSSPVSAYGRGAPNCRSTVPSHGRGPQASKAPYQVRYREKEEGGGEYEVEIITIYIYCSKDMSLRTFSLAQVTLSVRRAGESFRGFMLRGETTDGGVFLVFD